MDDSTPETSRPRRGRAAQPSTPDTPPAPPPRPTRAKTAKRTPAGPTPADGGISEPALTGTTDRQTAANGPASKPDQADSPTKATPTEATPTKAAPTKAAPTKATPAKASTAKAAPAKASPKKAGATKSTPAKAGPAKANPTKANPTKANPAKANPAKASTAKASTAKAALATTSPATAATAADTSPPAIRPAVGPTTGEVAESIRTQEGLWRQLRVTPGHGPEYLAQAAVTRFTPGAHEWLARMRTTYPAATSDGLARLATREHTRLARAAGAVTVLSGPLGPLAGTAAMLAVQGRLVVHIAVAFGADPDPADILVLTGAHAGRQAAEAALADAEKPGAPAALWRMTAPLLGTLGGRAALKAVARIVPGAAFVLAATVDARLVERLAARAIAHYRRNSSRSLNSA